MNFKLIAADMDGTLLNDNKIITEETLRVIKAAVKGGAVFVFSTGRPPVAVSAYQRLIGTAFPVIAYNGAMILDGSGKIIFEQSLSSEATRSILRHASRYNTTACIWSHNRLFVNKLNSRAARYKINVMTEPLLCTDEEAIIREGITKILWFDTPERSAMFQRELAGKLPADTSFCPSTPEYLEFFNSGVSKGLSLRRLADSLGIKREEIIAFGDNFNDLEMLEYAGLGVAMANAPEEVKAAADFVTRNNNDDGVGYALSHFLRL